MKFTNEIFHRYVPRYTSTKIFYLSIIIFDISRLMNLENDRLYGMNSHDYHIFMQTLIPLVYRDLLPKEIWDVFTEISHFFRDIYSNYIPNTWRNLKRISSRQFINLRYIPSIIFQFNKTSTHTSIIQEKSWRPYPV